MSEKPVVAIAMPPLAEQAEYWRETLVDIHAHGNGRMTTEDFLARLYQRVAISITPLEF